MLRAHVNTEVAKAVEAGFAKAMPRIERQPIELDERIAALRTQLEEFKLADGYRSAELMPGRRS